MEAPEAPATAEEYFRGGLMWALEPEFLHSFAEGTGGEVQSGGGSLFATYHPIALLEGFEDQLPLMVFEALQVADRVSLSRD